jgi:group I intron endonuclease
MVIYKIENLINGKAYIGQTTRPLNERIAEYKYEHQNNYSFNDYLFRSFKKYGFQNFSFEIVDFAENIDELNAKEIHWIKHFDTVNRVKGYNIKEGGRNAPVAEETRKKMSIARRGKKQSEEWVKNRIPVSGTEEAKKYGRPKTLEQRLYISKNNGRPG